MRESRTAIDDPGDGKPPYRLGVLLVLVDERSRIFVGERSDMPDDRRPWQLPQGGIKAFYDAGRLTGQEPPAQAALRELEEELGPEVRASIMGIATQAMAFDFDRGFNPKYRGQKLWPVLMRYEGGGIDISRLEDGDDKPAFLRYEWRGAAEVIAQATASKAGLYRAALAAFGLTEHDRK